MLFVGLANKKCHCGISKISLPYVVCLGKHAGETNSGCIIYALLLTVSLQCFDSISWVIEEYVVCEIPAPSIHVSSLLRNPVQG